MTTTRYPSDTRIKHPRVAVKLPTDQPAKSRESLDAEHMAELAADPRVSFGV